MNCLRRHILNPPLLFSLVLSPTQDPRFLSLTHATSTGSPDLKTCWLADPETLELGASLLPELFSFFNLLKAQEEAKLHKLVQPIQHFFVQDPSSFFNSSFLFFFGSIWSRSSSRFSQNNCCNTHPQRGSDGRKPDPPYHKCGNNAEERTMTTNENRKLCTASKPSHS
jgi:hypothetical protein